MPYVRRTAYRPARRYSRGTRFGRRRAPVSMRRRVGMSSYRRRR